MIKLLDHQQTEVAKKIRAIFQVSYAIEAELLKAVDFPPLQRKLSSFINSENVFYGFHFNKELVGVIELRKIPKLTHIQSLVVDPSYFRKGVALKLMRFILENYNTAGFMVETGVDNLPATQLYKKLGFNEILEWNTNHGVRKVRFELQI